MASSNRPSLAAAEYIQKLLAEKEAAYRSDKRRYVYSAEVGQSWGMESDSVLAWASDEVAPGGDADFVSSAALYASYSSWCAGRGEQLVERSVFGRRLTRAGFVGKNRGGRGYLVRNLTEAEKTAKRCWKT